MQLNPYQSAVAAGLYIVLVVSLMQFASVIAKPDDTILAPIAFLSTFVLSAAVMGYLFLLQPITMYMEGKKDGAIRHFLKTVAAFSLITATIFLLAIFVR